MKSKKLLAAALLSVMMVGSVATAAPVSAARSFSNCTALNKAYPHGVGKPGAKDKISGRYQPGKSVTNFKVSRALYNANDGMDRDHDGIACEKR